MLPGAGLRIAAVAAGSRSGVKVISKIRSGVTPGAALDAALGAGRKLKLRLDRQSPGLREFRKTAVCSSVWSGMSAAIEAYPVSEASASPARSGRRRSSADSLRHPQLTVSIALRCFKRITLPTHATLCRARHHLFGTLAVTTIGRWGNQLPYGHPPPAIAGGCEMSPSVRTSGSGPLQARRHPDCMNLPTAEARPIDRKTSTRTRLQAATVDSTRQVAVGLANSRMIIPAYTHIGASGQPPL